jgi:hypothetical protein
MSSNDGITRGIMRSATAAAPRCRNALPRIRAVSRHVNEKSTSDLASKSARCRSLNQPTAKCSVSAVLSTA